MTYDGVAKGKFIEFNEPLPYHGQAVRVSIEPLSEQVANSSAAAILIAVRQPPNLDSQIVDELEREIDEGELPIQADGLFDASKDS